MLRWCVLTLLLSVVIKAADPTHGCHGKPSFADKNPFPIQTNSDKTTKLVASVENGKKYVVTVPNAGGNTTSTFHLVHLYGTPREWGIAQGTLMKEEGSQFIDRTWKYFEEQVEGALPKAFPKWLQKLISDFGLDIALDLTQDATKKFTNPAIYEELEGIAEASGINLKKIIRVHMIAGLTQGACSMMGAWGDALPKGAGLPELVQLRALDWDMDGPFRDFNQITVYHPTNQEDGHAHLLIGYTAFVGGLTGVSETQLGISEIGASYPDASFGKESRIGVPFIFILRDILQRDYSISDAENRLINEKRTCDLILGVGDGKTSTFHGYEYSSSVLDIMDDTNLRPDNSSWHPRIPNVVYWGMDWECPSFNYVLSTLITRNHGKITPELGAIEISAQEGSGDNHLAYYDLTNMMVTVSMAGGFKEGGNPAAYARQFTLFDAKALFAEKQQVDDM